MHQKWMDECLHRKDEMEGRKLLDSSFLPEISPNNTPGNITEAQKKHTHTKKKYKT